MLALPLLRVATVFLPERAARLAAPGLAWAHLLLAAWVAARGAAIVPAIRPSSAPQWSGLLPVGDIAPIAAAWELLLALAALTASPRRLAPLMLSAVALLVAPGPVQALFAGLAALFGGHPAGAPPGDFRPGNSRPSERWLWGWRLGLLGAAIILLGMAPALPIVAPMIGLVFLVAQPGLPILSFALLTNLTITSSAAWWPATFCAVGLLAVVPRQKLLEARLAAPLLWLGVMLAARAADLSESALAAAEAAMLTLALQPDRGTTPDRISILTRSVLPGAAGFLPLWLGLHATFGLAAAVPSWMIGAVALALAAGWMAAQKAKTDWIDFATAPSFAAYPLASSASALVVPIALAICPGLMFAILRPAMTVLSDAVPSGAWWSVMAGDGGRWYPALASLLLGLPMAILTFSVPLRVAPAVVLGTMFDRQSLSPSPFMLRRALVRIRRVGTASMQPFAALTSANLGDYHARIPTLALWLGLLGLGLAMLGWRV